MLPECANAVSTEESMKLVNPSAADPKAAFAEPTPYGYIYIGMKVDPPGRAPIVRRSGKRDEAIQACVQAARALKDHPEIVDVTVYKAVFMPPIEGAPRFDVVVLISTSSPGTIAEVQGTEPYQRLAGDLVMTARNVRRIGDTGRSGTFLLNHFTAADPDEAVDVWEHLTGWYVNRTGVDNSTLLRPLEDAPYAVVNQVRLPQNPALFLARQFLRPSFYTYVQANLRANGMRALPVFYKPV
jgi:hypothetical protein